MIKFCFCFFFVTDPSMMKCKITLKNRELWQKFHDIGNEMIITKSGRYVHI